MKDYGKTVKFTSEDLIKATGSDFIAEFNEFFGKGKQKDAELKNSIAELGRQVQDYKEENVKLLQTLLALHRAVKRANVELDKIEEKCEADAWFQRLKERTY